MRTKIKNQQSTIKSWIKGFTLIELLIVIAIIGVLSALLMANFIGVRQRARDAQRKSDMRQIQSALELYRSDQGSYPVSLPSCGSPLTGGTSTYMTKVPCDPLGNGQSGTGNNYTYSSGGTTYTLSSCLENTADSQRDANNNGSNTCSPAGSKTSYTLNNP